MDHGRNWQDESELETLAHRAGLTPDELRAWLRAEVTRRLRETAKGERVEFPCRVCGEATDIAQTTAEKVTRGSVRLPLCIDCRSPARTAEVEAEVVRFVELLGDSAEELAAAVAALR